MARVSFHNPPLLIITSPVNVFVPVALLSVIVPVTAEMPETVILNPPTISCDPDAISRLVQAALAVIVTVSPPSIKTSSPATGTLAPATPPEVADHVAVEFQLLVATEYRVNPND